MGLSTPTQSGHITVTQAADELGLKPWEVMRLIQSGELSALVLVQTTSVIALKEKRQ